MTDSTSLPVDTRLMSRCAEMLALPHAVCRRRQCHRRNRCYWHFNSGQPCCLSNLTGPQRATFDALYSELLAVIRRYQSGHAPDFTSPDPERRALQDAAAEIVRALLSAKALPPFETWWRRREKHPIQREAAR